MSETPKQRARKLLEQLPLDEKTQREFDFALELVSEDDVEEVLEVYDEMLEYNPTLLEDVIEAIRSLPDSNEEDV